MKLCSNNEWDRLRAVVVGTVDGFVPGLEAPAGRSDLIERALPVAMRAFAGPYLDEVAEDLDGMCRELRNFGVEILRPSWREERAQFETPNWCAAGFDIYNVRDIHAVFGNTLVVSAPTSRFRFFEPYALQQLFYEHFFDDGMRWISAPIPRLRGQYLHEIARAPTPLEKKEDTLARHMSGGVTGPLHRLDDHEIIFDAANVIRLGRDVLYLVSSTGNRKGARWLQEVLGADYRVHVTNAYRSSHLDSTIIPLREGFVLLNGARVNEDNCPSVFDGWDKLYFSDVASLPESEVAWQNEVRTPVYNELMAMGVTSSLNHVSSPWAGLNVLSLDERTVMVHDRQASLIAALEQRGFTVVPVPMRHCYTMLGGLHCTTLDVRRS